MTTVLLLVIVPCAQAEWIHIKITAENGMDWPPAAMPEWSTVNLTRQDALAYDPERKVLVLFKGRRTFEFTGLTWKITDSGSMSGPGHLESYSALWSPLVVFHPKSKGVLLYGGYSAHEVIGYALPRSVSWIWNGSEWLPPIGGSVRQVPIAGHAGALNMRTGQIIIFGGETHLLHYQRNTFVYEGDIWKQVTRGKPTPRVRPAMAYDEKRDVMVLFGGYQKLEYPVSKVFSDTWEWDGKQWTRITNSGPGPRAGHSLVYLPELKRVVLFGGFSAPLDPDTGKRVLVPHNDLWSWDGKSWTRLPHTRPAPNPRYGHGAAYDSNKQQMVIYGGEDGTKSFRDLWYYRADK